MTKKKKATKDQSTVKVRNISEISGNVNIAGGDITTHQVVSGVSAAEIKQIFEQLFSHIEMHKEIVPADIEDIKAEVEEIRFAINDAIQKNKKVDESFLARRFRNIGRMAPDILDVAVATLEHPLAGMGIAVKKIIEKANQEAKQS